MSPRRGLCDGDTSSCHCVPGSYTDVTVTFMMLPFLVPLLRATHFHSGPEKQGPGQG